jgi:hypothetical protein
MTWLTRMAASGAAWGVLAGSPALAQDCTVGIRPPVAGSWVQYTMPQGTMRLALLGNEVREGKNLFRMEVAMTSKEGPMIMQVLAPGYPYEMSSIRDFVMKPPGSPAMRMSAQMLQMMSSRMPRDQIAEACRNAKMTRVGEESITVPGGTFSTIHYRDATSGSDVWVGESVPFGLVKARTSDGEIVLTAKGTDAKSQITETPQEMGN